MPDKIFVSGIGITSAIGEDIAQNLSSLIAEKSGIGEITILDTVYKNDYLAGEIKLSNAELAKQVKVGQNANFPRTALIALKAAKEAFISAELNNVDPYKIGFIGGTTVGGMDKTEKYYSANEEKPDFILSHSSGYISEIVAEQLNIKGYLSTFNTACSSSTNAIITGARLIQHGIVDIVIAGGFDCLTKFTLNGFKTLLILSPEMCAPFDQNRQGLNLGEGAGFIVLESEKSITQRGIKPLCILSGYANANDAFHQTASSPDGEGAYLSMLKALKIADLAPDMIDYINVHGTGTENNDATEGMAIKRLFKNSIPPFSSTKPFTGHTLGASGGIEAVFSVLALQENLIYPNLNFKTPIENLNILPVTHLIKNKKINHVMSNSFGFGGNDSTLIFSKI